jgi:uncharacterized protein
MSKPEAKPGQSLEEILASIRKALAEEEVQGGADAPVAAEPSREPVARPVPDAAPKGDSLPGKLSVALNGSAHDAAPDDDLNDLLAPLPSKASGAPRAEQEAAPPASGESKDPLWFLARKPAPDSENIPDEPAPEPVRAEEKAAEPEASTLTRLESIRSSLPPLFGGGEPDEVKAEAVNLVQPASPKLKDIPAVPAFEKPKEEERAKAAAAPAAHVDLSAPLPTPPPPNGVLRPAGPAAPAAEAMASALTGPRPGGAKESPAAAQARALEDMIGKMLEPLIRNWLEANLPRLVEKVVREEVARASGGKPDAPKG